MRRFKSENWYQTIARLYSLSWYCRADTGVNKQWASFLVAGTTQGQTQKELLSSGVIGSYFTPNIFVSKKLSK